MRPVPTTAYRLVGRVFDAATGAPVAGARVEAWSRDGEEPSLGLATATDEQGSFALQLTSPAEPVPAIKGPVVIDGDGGGGPPDPLLRVVRGETILVPDHAPIKWSSSGEGEVVLRVPVSDEPPSTEVGLQEIGQSLATAVARVQAELGRYPNALGAFVVDELELTVPVQMRMDDLGQIRTTVVSSRPADEEVGELHLRVRPVLGAHGAPTVTSGQPLQSLKVLSAETLAKLAAQRIFSVDDLLAAAQSGAGRTGLAALGTDVDKAVSAAQVLALPNVPPAVGAALLEAGVRAPASFVRRDPARLARSLSSKLGQPVTAADVKSWQEGVQTAMSVPLPRTAATA